MIKERLLYKILVIEDNLGDFILLEAYLSDHFLQTEIVNIKSYAEFVEVVRTDTNFDIVFLDLTLPDKFGLDLVRACVDLIPFIPIVVLTGYQDFNFAVQSLSLGISDYLLKENLSATTLHKCIIYNIERHKNFQKTKESEQQYLELFQLTPNPLFVYDVKTRLILNVNNAALEKYKYSLEELLVMKIDALKATNTQLTDIDTDLIDSDTENKFTLNKIETHKNKNNERLFVMCSSNKIIYEGNESLVLSVEDHTNEIKHMRSIQKQNKKLREIAWTQSHLVRAPLAKIMGLVTVLGGDEIPLEEKNNLYSMLKNSSEELDAVIRKIVGETKEI